MKTLLYCLAVFLLLQTTNAQPPLRAIMLKKKFGYQLGDTVQIKGYCNQISNHPNKYVIKSVNGTNRFISPVNLKIIDTIQNFWDYQWFINRSGKIACSGSGIGLRSTLNTEYNVYLDQLKKGNLLYDDAEMLDYLDNLIQRIGPSKLYKGFSAKMSIHVIKSDITDIFSFDNGAIFLTTSLLVNTQTEEELIKLLTNEIAHIIDDHQFLNRKSKNSATALLVGVIAVATIAVIVATADNEDDHNDHHHDNWFFDGYVYESYRDYSPPVTVYSRPNSLSKYNSAQIATSQRISNFYMTNEYGKIDHLSTPDYIRNISGVFTYTAWNKYFKTDYKGSLALINRLESNGNAGSDDYLLKAKIYRKLYTTDEAKYEALKYIQMAKDVSNDTNIELLKEEGLIYYQLQDMPKAHASFEEYRYALDKVGVNDENDRRELSWADQMIQKTQ